MLYPKEIGLIVRNARQFSKLTQKQASMRAGTGLRFIIELEQGKNTCQIGKALAVLAALGVEVKLEMPTAPVPLAKLKEHVSVPPSSGGNTTVWNDGFLD